MALDRQGAAWPISRAETPAVSPRMLCREHAERAARRRAALAAELDLTAPQRRLWEEFERAAAASAVREIAALDALPAEAGLPVTLPLRHERLERILAARLAALRAIRPALERLYRALSPAQRAVLDRGLALSEL